MKTDIVVATERYESWLRTLVPVIDNELDYKHAQMASRKDVFPFFRGTYYRWVEIWPTLCPGCVAAPRVLSVGDLHIENFGTWRDREARLIWGVNDFDESDDLPFTNDLVRLAASAALGADGADFRLSLKKTCRAILAGYVSQLEGPAQPFVLEEDHLEMRNLATHADRDPVVFWGKLIEELKQAPVQLPEGVEAVLKRDLQGQNVVCELRARNRVGMGSLGKPRYLALASFQGGWVAREAKALTPPVTALFNESSSGSRVTEIIAQAVRCHDPIFRVDGAWICRRLAPRCSRIEMKVLTRVADEQLMLESMGAETANIHWGTPAARESILEWLEQHEVDWLVDAANTMIRATRDDWKAWRKHYTKVIVRFERGGNTTRC